MSALNVMAECFMTGIVAGLTIWVLARLGLIPILLYQQVDKDEEE